MNIGLQKHAIMIPQGVELSTPGTNCNKQEQLTTTTSKNIKFFDPNMKYPVNTLYITCCARNSSTAHSAQGKTIHSCIDIIQRINFFWRIDHKSVTCNFIPLCMTALLFRVLDDVTHCITKNHRWRESNNSVRQISLEPDFSLAEQKTGATKTTGEGKKWSVGHTRCTAAITPNSFKRTAEHSNIHTDMCACVLK